MRSRHLPMSFDEFERMPRELGWKFEYWDGQAHISPGHQVVVVNLATAPRPVAAPCPIRPLSDADAPGLIAAYAAAFCDNIEFCDESPREVLESAHDAVGRFLAGKRGQPLPASRVACAPGPGGSGETLVGAALLVDAGPGEAILDMLFIVPDWQRRELGTALVADAVNALHAAGVGTLESRYVLGNAPSRAWHRKFGFEELPDLMLARHYWRYFQGEIRRLELIGDASAEALEELARRMEYWWERAEALEKIADEQGYEAVTPFLRRR